MGEVWATRDTHKRHPAAAAVRVRALKAGFLNRLRLTREQTKAKHDILGKRT